ncbi:MAG: hypothetical protein EDM03_08775 [Porphyrobacter sp. IPPAS B-1204]|nr:MAG: hypothetical protein EDM03_08775 [Porphyrobacter sp. IPPAS B-1204]
MGRRPSRAGHPALSPDPRGIPEPRRARVDLTFENQALLGPLFGQFGANLVSRRQRKKVEMLFAHIKRILRMDRLRVGGCSGARDEFFLAATARNLRKMPRLILMPANQSLS